MRFYECFIYSTWQLACPHFGEAVGVRDVLLRTAPAPRHMLATLKVSISVEVCDIFKLLPMLSGRKLELSYRCLQSHQTPLKKTVILTDSDSDLPPTSAFCKVCFRYCASSLSPNSPFKKPNWMLTSMYFRYYTMDKYLIKLGPSL